MKTYKIYEGYMEKLTKKLTRIQNKCRKYGCEFHFSEVGEEFQTIKNKDGSESLLRFVIIEAEGTAVINDWEFTATIEHHGTGNLIKGYGNHGEDVPVQYRTAYAWCDHCKKIRPRNNTYLVRNVKTGEYKQLGRNCLCDYTHGLTAEAVAASIEWDSTIENIMDDDSYTYGGGCGGFHAINWYDVSDVLCYTLAVVNRVGYVSKSRANELYEEGKNVDPTATKVRQYIDLEKGRLGRSASDIRKEMEKLNLSIDNILTTENRENAQKIIKWATSTDDACNDYRHNLAVVCGMEAVDYRNIGILVSAVPAYAKAMDSVKKREERKQEHSTSEYVGEIKERLTIDVSEFKYLTGWETDYGYTRLYQIVDKVGNVYTWKASSCSLEEGEESKVVKVVGTVKDHTEYNGVRQTVLTRCKLTLDK